MPQLVVQTGRTAPVIASAISADGTVVATIIASRASAVFRQDGVNSSKTTGVYGLRLFRTGQIVGYLPEGDEGKTPMDLTVGANGRLSHAFTVPLPHDGARTAEFTAYVFNVDQVKSVNDHLSFIFQQPLTPIGGQTVLFHASQFRARLDLNSSLALLDECLPLEWAASADGHANPVILGRLADVVRWVGRPGRAVAFLIEALELCRGLQDSDPGGYMSAMGAAGRWHFRRVNSPKSRSDSRRP